MLNLLYSFLHAFYKHLQIAFASGQPKPEEITATTRRDRRKLERQIKPELKSQYCKPQFSSTIKKKLRK